MTKEDKEYIVRLKLCEEHDVLYKQECENCTTEQRVAILFVMYLRKLGLPHMVGYNSASVLNNLEQHFEKFIEEYRGQLHDIKTE
jgi:hypothetical protein